MQDIGPVGYPDVENDREDKARCQGTYRNYGRRGGLLWGCMEGWISQAGLASVSRCVIEGYGQRTTYASGRLALLPHDLHGFGDGVGLDALFVQPFGQVVIHVVVEVYRYSG